MRELNIEQRLDKIDDNLAVLRRMMEQVLNQSKDAKPADENEIMSVKQLAPFLGLDPAIIYAKCTRDEIPYFKLGKQYRFRKAEITKWLKEQKESSQGSVDDYVANYLQRNILKS